MSRSRRTYTLTVTIHGDTADANGQHITDMLDAAALRIEQHMGVLPVETHVTETIS